MSSYRLRAGNPVVWRWVRRKGGGHATGTTESGAGVGVMPVRARAFTMGLLDPAVWLGCATFALVSFASRGAAQHDRLRHPV